MPTVKDAGQKQSSIYINLGNANESIGTEDRYLVA